MSRAAVLALLMLLILSAGVRAQPSSCRAARGMEVTLFGGVDDPDVLVWDSRERLVNYAAGSSDERKFLLPHALLSRPGTRAMVQLCYGGIVHSKFRIDSQDAVAVRILDGRYRGRSGWVSSADVHGAGIPELRDRW
jgi:hypothetical protein